MRVPVQPATHNLTTHLQSLLQIHPTWPKGFYRQASALQALQQHTAAVQALQQALLLAEKGSQEVSATPTLTDTFASTNAGAQHCALLPILCCPQAADVAKRLAAAATVAEQQQRHQSIQQQMVSSHAAWAKNRAREVSVAAAFACNCAQHASIPPA